MESSGRFDKHIKNGNIDSASMEVFLESHLRKIQLELDADLFIQKFAEQNTSKHH